MIRKLLCGSQYLLIKEKIIMDWTLFTKFVVAGVGIFTAWKVLFETSNGKRSSLRDEYNFAKTFLDDTEKNELHPFTLEKGYQAIAGSTMLRVSEIEFILSLKKPLQCLNDFSSSKQLFERLDTTGDFELIFKKEYSSRFSRGWRKLTYMALYWILSFTALSPLIFSKFFDIELQNMLIQTLFTLPFFGLYAWIALKANINIVRAERLFSNQVEHSPMIVLDDAV